MKDRRRWVFGSLVGGLIVHAALTACGGNGVVAAGGPMADGGPPIAPGSDPADGGVSSAGGSCTCSVSGAVTVSNPITLAGPVTIAGVTKIVEADTDLDQLERKTLVFLGSDHTGLVAIGPLVITDAITTLHGVSLYIRKDPADCTSTQPSEYEILATLWPGDGSSDQVVKTTGAASFLSGTRIPLKTGEKLCARYFGAFEGTVTVTGFRPY